MAATKLSRPRVALYILVVGLIFLTWNITTRNQIPNIKPWTEGETVQSDHFHLGNASPNGTTFFAGGNFIPGSNQVIHVDVPSHISVVGLVFYGRREYVEILDYYLQRNLKHNGGLLDEIVLSVNTDNSEDLEYLEMLLSKRPGYTKHTPSGGYSRYQGQWEAALESRENIYIKIDDDIVFIEDNAIPAIVKRLLDEPYLFAVSANVVNNPALSWVHFSMGLYHPYLPEIEKPAKVPPKSWRASDLPVITNISKTVARFSIEGDDPAPFKGHRWLPVGCKDGIPFDVNLTPASTLRFNAFGGGWNNWAAAAQTHYSFLQHLEEEDIWRYKFDLWDYNYKRLSINFFAIRGVDIADAFPMMPKDDEKYLTISRPMELGRHVIVEGGGLAVHFAFSPQLRAHGHKGVGWTDLLERYRLYAKEKVSFFQKKENTISL